MLPQLALAGFVLARADDELWALAMDDLLLATAGAGDTQLTAFDESRRRLREQALVRRELAERYLRLHRGARRVDEATALELLRGLCLAAGLDRGHADYEAAVDDCPLDCDYPLW